MHLSENFSSEHIYIYIYIFPRVNFNLYAMTNNAAQVVQAHHMIYISNMLVFLYARDVENFVNFPQVI